MNCMTQDLNQLKKDKKKSLVKNRPTPVPHPADFTLAPPHPGGKCPALYFPVATLEPTKEELRWLKKELYLYY